MSAARAGALASLAALLLLAGCGGKDSTASDSDSAGSSSSPTATASAGACASPDSSTTASWPTGVPTEIPLPAGSEVQSSDVEDGITRIRFLIPLSFVDSVKLYLDGLPAAGFVLGSGDSEASEADIPFTKDEGQFSLKISGLTDPCHSQGLLAIGGDADAGDGDGDTDGDGDGDGDTDAPSSVDTDSGSGG